MPPTSAPIGMWEQIRANRRKTAFLVIGMATLLFGLGFVFAEFYVPGGGMYGLAVAGGVWAIMTLVAYAGGDNILLALSGAKEIEKQDHPELFNVVEEMTIASGLGKMPRVYVVPDQAMNAFAVGRKKEKAAVAVTAGLLGRMDRDELQGVVAHEVAHIVNRDVLLMTMLSVLLGTIVMTSEIFLRSLRFSGSGARYSGGGRRGGGKGGGEGAAMLVIFAIALVLAILAPLLAQLIYMAVSRRREYLADASGAVFTRYPEGLASALEKLGGSAVPVERASKATAAMYIVNPFAKAKLSAMTATHPPIADRVRVLRSMGGTATFATYQQAWKNELGKKRGPLPASALQDTAHGGAVRAPVTPMRKDAKQQVRETGDILRSLNQFVFLPCTCGLKVKLPPNYPKSEIECPRCHTMLRVPVAELAAMQAAGAQKSGDIASLSEIPTATPRASVSSASVQTVRRKPGEWMTFQCGCGRMTTLSPDVIATRVKCPACARETQLIE